MNTTMVARAVRAAGGSTAAFSLGAMGWVAAEYAIHRFVGHGPRRHRLAGLARVSAAGLAAEFNEEHVAHHANPSYFAPTSHKLLAATAALALMGSAGTALVGPRRAFSFAAGFASSYLAYEVAHRRVHTHPPTSRLGRWRRKHHLYHHHRSPRMNHGVTAPWFDQLFGTHVATDGVVRVPAWMAPPWMVDGAGALRPEFARDYALVQPKRAREQPSSPRASSVEQSPVLDEA